MVSTAYHPKKEERCSEETERREGMNCKYQLNSGPSNTGVFSTPPIYVKGKFLARSALTDLGSR